MFWMAACTVPAPEIGETDQSETDCNRLRYSHIYRIIYSRISGHFENARIRLKGLVGLPGFEPGTSCTPNRRSVHRFRPVLNREETSSYKNDYRRFRPRLEIACI